MYSLNLSQVSVVCNDNTALVADPTLGGGRGDVGGGGGHEGDRHRPKIKVLSP